LERVGASGDSKERGNSQQKEGQEKTLNEVEEARIIARLESKRVRKKSQPRGVGKKLGIPTRMTEEEGRQKHRYPRVWNL